MSCGGVEELYCSPSFIISMSNTQTLPLASLTLKTRYNWQSQTHWSPGIKNSSDGNFFSRSLTQLAYFEMSGRESFTDTDRRRLDLKQHQVSSVCARTMWIVLQVWSSSSDQQSMTANSHHDSLHTDSQPGSNMSAVQSPKYPNQRKRNNLWIRILLLQHFRKFFKQRMEASGGRDFLWRSFSQLSSSQLEESQRKICWSSAVCHKHSVLISEFWKNKNEFVLNSSFPSFYELGVPG